MDEARRVRQRILSVARRSVATFRDADCGLSAAALAHFAVLAVVPFIMVGVGLMESVSDADATQVTELGTTEAYESVARPVRAFLAFIEPEMAVEIRHVVRDHHWSGLLGYLALIATVGLFGWGLRRSLGRIFPANNSVGFLRERLSVFGFLLLALVLIATSSLLWRALDGFLDPAPRDATFSTLVLALGFMISVKWLGQKRASWRHLAVGAVLFCLAWQLAVVAFSSFIESKGFAETYGALGGVACIMVWLYYASLVYLACCCVVKALDEPQDRATPAAEELAA